VMADKSRTIFSSSLDSNIFDGMETTRGTSWQYELQQLRIANLKLRAEIDDEFRLQTQRQEQSHVGNSSTDAPP
jgi:hypothetical protein